MPWSLSRSLSFFSLSRHVFLHSFFSVWLWRTAPRQYLWTYFPLKAEPAEHAAWQKEADNYTARATIGPHSQRNLRNQTGREEAMDSCVSTVRLWSGALPLSSPRTTSSPSTTDTTSRLLDGRTEIMLVETMLADLRARAARVCRCKRTGCTTRKILSCFLVVLSWKSLLILCWIVSAYRILRSSTARPRRH